jgi:hypothetical protein
MTVNSTIFLAQFFVFFTSFNRAQNLLHIFKHTVYLNYREQTEGWQHPSYMYTTLNFYEGIMVKNEQFSRVGKKNIHILTGNKSFFKLPYDKQINHREKKIDTGRPSHRGAHTEIERYREKAQ